MYRFSPPPPFLTPAVSLCKKALSLARPSFTYCGLLVHTLIAPPPQNPHPCRELVQEGTELGPALVLGAPSDGPDEGEHEHAVQQLEGVLGGDLGGGAA